MLKTLVAILAPGTKLPEGAAQFSFSYEGLSGGWAFFIFVLLVALVAWSYRKYASRISWPVRLGLVVLRSILIAGLLLLLVRPILLLTGEESVRRPLIVLLDVTQSMGLVDRRTAPDDIMRGAIAEGLVDPAGGLKQQLPAAAVAAISRQKLLEDLAANPRLNFWPRLFQQADLSFFGVGRDVTDLGPLMPGSGTNLTLADSVAFFKARHYDENLTALGDGLHDVLDKERGQPIAGILFITDGGNNSGTPPIEAAALARDDGVPLFLYGVGVTTPQDIIVTELSGPQVTNVKEKVMMTVHIRVQNMSGRKGTVQLKANGVVVDQQPIEFRADGDEEVSLGYTPQEVGEVDLEAYIPPLPEETVKDNNSATAHLRVVDNRLNVLFIQSEPSWDFEYLLAMLQADRRTKVKVVLLHGDPDLADAPDSPFLKELPDDKESLFGNDIIIIGDVDPAELGDTRMKLINDWVTKVGGGLIFLAGHKFDPYAYLGTPLETLLPVEPQTTRSDRYPQPVSLTLTPAGETSPLLSLSDNPQENEAIWAKFPPVHWTAQVGKARPGAQVLLTDPTESRANSQGAMPVIALQSYGLGQILYLGFDETYRWRSHVGEKYYTAIWGQMLQVLSNQRTLGVSALTQLKTNRPSYLTGDRIKISGRIFKSSFEPVTDPDIPGILTIQAQPFSGQPVPAPQTTELHLQSVPDRPGEYSAELVGKVAGNYSFVTVRDPSVVLKFEVAEPKVELSDTAMNAKLLQNMAAASGGTFLREEDLDRLPDLITKKSADTVSFKKIPLSFAPILLAIMVAAATLEWFWRRHLELK
jgi:uncharacterized membrane protein